MQPRVIWPPASRAVTGVSPEIEQIVVEVYTNHDLLPSEWTSRQRRDFLRRETVRLSSQIASLADNISESAVHDWINRTGDHPGFMAKARLVNNATRQAKEIVLNQALYELIPLMDEEDEESGKSNPPMPDRSEVPWDRRWTHTKYRAEPTEEQEDLAAMVWPAPTFTALFRIKAEYLIAARAEDQLPIPTDQHDPLAEILALMVYADLRADGLPVQ